MSFPINASYKNMPTVVEYHDKNGRITKISQTRAWRKIVSHIGKQLKAGGAITMETKKVCIMRRKVTPYGKTYVVPGTIVEVADVEFVA